MIEFIFLCVVYFASLIIVAMIGFSLGAKDEREHWARKMIESKQKVHDSYDHLMVQARVRISELERQNRDLEERLVKASKNDKRDKRGRFVSTEA